MAANDRYNDGPGFTERRKTPRVHVPGRLQARLLGRDERVLVINLGLGGFRLQSKCAFEAGTQHELSFELSDGSELEVGARVVHTLQRVGADGGPVHLTGFEFLEEAHRDNRAAAEEILQDLAFQLSVKAVKAV